MLVDFKERQIAVKEYDCRLGTIPPKRLAPHVNLFVKVTKGCNAHCPFCSNAGCIAPSSSFNISKLIDEPTLINGRKFNRLTLAVTKIQF
jgi:tRNA A37 methylthiotransferase MiaB